MANLKTTKTASGAQQYSSEGGAKKLVDSMQKDVKAYIDKKMTAAEFKKKYGVSVAKAQNMMYGAAAAERSKTYKKDGYSDPAETADNYEKSLARDRKKIGMYKGGMAKKGYNKGGYCGASNPAERPMKKGK